MSLDEDKSAGGGAASGDLDLTREGVYRDGVSTPHVWWEWARDFRRASELVWTDVPQTERRAMIIDQIQDAWIWAMPASGMLNPYVTLIAHATECLLKARVVERESRRLAAGEQIPESQRTVVEQEHKKLGKLTKLSKVVANHDLAVLAATAGIVDLTEPESSMLIVLTDAYSSWARFPGGLHHKSGDVGPPMVLDAEALRATFIALFDRLEVPIIEGLVDRA